MLESGQTPGILAIDRDFRITSFSKRAQQLTGYAKEEVLGKRCLEMFCDLPSEQQCPMRKSLDTGMELYGQMVPFRTKGQNTLPFRVTTLPLQDPLGQMKGGVESFWPLQTASSSLEDLTEDLQHFHAEHPQLQKILNMLPDVARSDAPVLLVGENGTGKNSLARAIHRLSRRAGGAFVKVDCGAYRERVLEVELFGCCRSMVHGIEEDRSGRIQFASSGTIFIREIDHLPSHLQAKLIRFIQDGEVEPVGGNQPVAVDTRLIGACHTNPKSFVEEGTFREDLFFRLNVFLLEIPPLRSIQEAIPHLISRIIQRYNAVKEKEVQGISSDALDILMGYSFPGNIKELDNIIHHAHVLCKGKEIQPAHLPDGILDKGRTFYPPLRRENGKRMEEIERDVILAALARNQWNRKKTAQELGIDRTTLWRKMRKMGWGSKLRPHAEAE